VHRRNTLSDTELRALITEAYVEGARRTLERLGLHDDDAPADIRSLRDLLDAWRQIKRGAFQQLGKWLMIVVLGALVLLAGHRGWLS
jgi:hypothetical protein